MSEAWIQELFLHTVHTWYHTPTHTCTDTHLGEQVMAGVELESEPVTVTALNFLSLRGNIKEDISKFFQDVLESFLQLNVWLWFTLFTERLSAQSCFGHPAITVQENAGSRHQRPFQDYSSQEHEITLWQIPLPWQDTMSLIRSLSVLNQFAYKCPKLNQAAPWNVASWLYWSLTQTGQHLAPWPDFLGKSGAFYISFTLFFGLCSVWKIKNWLQVQEAKQVKITHANTASKTPSCHTVLIPKFE